MSTVDIAEITTAPITSHAFNKTRDQVAICPNSNDIVLYKKVGTRWQITDTLIGHDQRVMCVDWAPESNRIVSCGEDRNAYVWNLSPAQNQWKPTLVILRINRAATCCKWSPREDKFAVGSSSRLLSVCYFEQENDWWVSKHIKKPIRSTILSLNWHPDNILIAAGSSDFTARIFSGFIKGVDDKSADTLWGERSKFGDLLKEFPSGGWVHSVSFSADGSKLAWTGHDSSLSIVAATGANANQVVSLFLKDLPLRCALWVNQNSIVAAGHDCYPVIFQADHRDNWSFIQRLDQSKKKTASSSSAMNKFKMLDSRAQNSEGAPVDVALDSIHQNAISTITPHSLDDHGSVAKFTTSGVDGRLVTWDVKSLEASIAGLKINA